MVRPILLEWVHCVIVRARGGGWTDRVFVYLCMFVFVCACVVYVVYKLMHTYACMHACTQIYMRMCVVYVYNSCVHIYILHVSSISIPIPVPRADPLRSGASDIAVR